MTIEKFYKANDEKFLSLGFKKESEDDPMFYYSKDIISQESIEESDLEEDEIPKLLLGDSGLNKGFCIYTGAHFIWLNVATPEEAIEFSSKITAFEEV